MATDWRSFATAENVCPLCGHGPHVHLISVAQPVVFRPATEDEKADVNIPLWTSSEEGDVLLRRVVIAKRVEPVTVWCGQCAKELKTAQVLCYLRRVATGEIIGLDGKERRGDTNS